MIKLPQPKEKDVIRGILDYLMLAGIPHGHFRNTGNIFVDKKTGKTRFGKHPLNQKGVADILGCWKGKPFAIEVKSTQGKLSPEQCDWLSRWKKNGGGRYLVARNIWDVQFFLGGF